MCSFIFSMTPLLRDLSQILELLESLYKTLIRVDVASPAKLSSLADA
jgi:hypothetical protein